MDPADRTLRAEGVEAMPAGLWERLRARPERAPELLALAAAERFAAPAARWVELHGTGARSARLARRKHARLSTLEGAALGIGGWVTAAADLAALVWIQSRMVFFIAAAYGFEPGHPMRPAELLALQDVYETPAEARAALDGLGAPLAWRLVERGLSSGGDEQLARKLLLLTGRRLARKGALRLIPLLASPINAAANRAATNALALRALRYYGGEHENVQHRPL